MRSWLAFTGLLALCACADVVDLNTTPGDAQLLVFGRVTSGLEGNIIQIATTSPINNGQQPEERAMVYLVHEDGERERYMPTSEPGVYELENTTLIGQPGESYHVEIQLVDGRRYHSVPEKMPQKAGQDHLDFEAGPIRIINENRIEISRNAVQLYVRSEIFDTEVDSYIRWNLLETFLFPERPQIVDTPDFPPQWCYVTNDLEEQAVFLYDGSELKTNEIARRLMTTQFSRDDFAVEYYFQVVQSSMTREAHRFWSDIYQVTNAQGSIFDRPMAPVVGNVFNVDNPDEDVLGYFEVSQVDTTRIMLNAQDLPFAVSRSCPLAGFVGPECSNCLLLKNSEKKKPHFLD